MAASTTPVVIVSEDEPILRIMAVDVVAEAGFEAVEGANAEEALTILRTRPGRYPIFTHHQDFEKSSFRHDLKRSFDHRSRA